MEPWWEGTAQRGGRPEGGRRLSSSSALFSALCGQGEGMAADHSWPPFLCPEHMPCCSACRPRWGGLAVPDAGRFIARALLSRARPAGDRGFVRTDSASGTTSARPLRRFWCGPTPHVGARGPDPRWHRLRYFRPSCSGAESRVSLRPRLWCSAGSKLRRGTALYLASRAGEDFVSSLRTRTQYINQLELLAAIAVYFSLRSLLRGRRVIHFIDNSSTKFMPIT